MENYPYWKSISVEKTYVGNGVYKYKLITKEYNYANLISTKEEDYDTEHNDYLGPDENTTVVGVVQKEYPDEYNIVTQLSQIIPEENKPFVYTMVNSTSGALGLYECCANCSALTSVDVKADLLTPFSAQASPFADYAFYNCSALTSVDVDDLFESGGITTNYMFTNCINLTTITGKFLVTKDSIYSMHNMFKGCTSLEGVQLIDQDNILMTDPELAGFDGLYYNLLGLTATDQFTVVSA
jgi:hypothetical protein